MRPRRLGNVFSSNSRQYLQAGGKGEKRIGEGGTLLVKRGTALRIRNARTKRSKSEK